MRVSDNEFRKEFSAGALPSQNVNVFIDGVSYKNDVIDGGVVGQDSSRGNPFPQSAVQEFQVLTQNFKAEYEKAASAIITAVTKSGGNRYSGELFNFYQDKALVENEAIVRDAGNLFVKGETTPKPTYERWQWGLALGGPIVRDRAQFFGSYEENRQDRAGNVLVGTVSTAPASLVQRLRAFEGVFTSPFREKLLFAKASLQPAQGQQAEITYNWRNETDIRGFGGQGASNSYQTAENVHNRVDSLQGKWQIAQHPLPERGLPVVPALPLEPEAGEPRHHRRELRGAAAHRRPRHRAVHRPAARVAARRLLAVPEVERQPHRQGRRRRQLPGLRRQQAVQRQPAVHLSRRHQLGLPGAAPTSAPATPT